MLSWSPRFPALLVTPEQSEGASPLKRTIKVSVGYSRFPGCLLSRKGACKQQPYDADLFPACSMFFGLLYPTWKSVEAVESKSGADDAQW